MAGFCLIPKIADEFIDRIKKGEITPEKLNSLDSAGRREYFAKFMGEEIAIQTNALYESKLLLKNQQRGIINWAKQVSGLKPSTRASIIERVNKLDKVFDPKSEKEFLNDLANKKLGIDVSFDEVKKITELSKEVMDKKEAFENGGDRISYGEALVDFNDYVEGLKHESNKTNLTDLKKNPVITIGKALVKGAGIMKSLKASLDNSAIGRQGLKVMLSNKGSGIWLKNALKSFDDIVKTFGGKNVERAVKADILSRPNAVNGKYKKYGLYLKSAEEAYPSSLPEKIPVLGRAFKASEAAYKNFMLRTRADLFDKYAEIADKTGADLTGIGEMINSLTGRGHLGSLERGADTLNNIFFSPRFLKSHIDLLTAHSLDKNISPYVRKQAALNLLKTISGIAGALTLANAVAPGSVEWDPRSSDFGKIKIKNTRFDATGGMASVATLASRLIRNSTKSSLTNKIKPLNSGEYGSKTSGDVIMDFFNNKLSPAASLIRDLLNRHDRDGAPLSLKKVALDTVTPITISTYQELKKDPNSADNLIAMIADGLGISTNTYSKESLKKKNREIKKLKRKQEMESMKNEI